MSSPLGTPGTAGGRVPTMSLREAQALLQTWRGEEFGWVRARIIALARRHGEYHADMMIGTRLKSPAAVGAAVNALANAGLLEKLNRAGVAEQRQTVNKTSRRASWVWRLTPKGRDVADALARQIGDKLPVGREEEPAPPESFMPTTDRPHLAILALGVLKAMSYGSVLLARRRDGTEHQGKVRSWTEDPTRRGRKVPPESRNEHSPMLVTFEDGTVVPLEELSEVVVLGGAA